MTITGGLGDIYVGHCDRRILIKIPTTSPAFNEPNRVLTSTLSNGMRPGLVHSVCSAGLSSCGRLKGVVQPSACSPCPVCNKPMKASITPTKVPVCYRRRLELREQSQKVSWGESRTVAHQGNEKADSCSPCVNVI